MTFEFIINYYISIQHIDFKLHADQEHAFILPHRFL